jgi:hypothetical protein
MRNVPSNLTNRNFDSHLSAKSQDVTHTPSTRSTELPSPQCSNMQRPSPTLVICLNRPHQGDDPSDRLGGGPLRRRIVQNVQLIPGRGQLSGPGRSCDGRFGGSAGRPLVIRFGIGFDRLTERESLLFLPIFLQTGERGTEVAGIKDYIT